MDAITCCYQEYDVLTTVPLIFLMFVCLMCESVNKRRARIRRHRRPCAYYANSCATFHLTLSRELIFKLNPGPVDRTQTPTIVTMRVDTRIENRSALNSRNLRYVPEEEWTSSHNALRFKVIYQHFRDVIIRLRRLNKSEQHGEMCC